MSTRCNIHFCHQGVTIATIYRHSDGYPTSEHGVIESLQKFFSQVEEETPDTRFTDPSYLAAKYVVWQANEYSRGSRLNFLSVGISNQEAGDIEYRYFVECSKLGEDKRPIVTHEEA